jgi:hypothetical protein
MAKTYLRTKEGIVFESSHPEYHPDCERLTRAEGEKARKEYCREELHKLLKPGDSVYAIVRHVSSSGMSRRISLYVVTDNRPRNIDELAADAIGYRTSDKGGIVVGGCGMDMAFHLVYCLGRALFPTGFGLAPHSSSKVKMLKASRPATPKQAAAWKAKGVEFWGRNGESSGWDNDGGYALQKEWL